MKFKDLIKKTQLSLMNIGKGQVKITAAGVIFENEGKFLLVKERSDMVPKKYGTWNFPIEKKKKGEKLYKCALRRGRKKISYFLKLDGPVRPSLRKKFYNVDVGSINISIYLFEASLSRGELKAASDRWFTLDQIKELQEIGLLFDPYIISAITDWKKLQLKKHKKEAKNELPQS